MPSPLLTSTHLTVMGRLPANYEVLRDEKRAHINALVPVYRQVWHHFDPAGAGFIKREQLVSFGGSRTPRGRT